MTRADDPRPYLTDQRANTSHCRGVRRAATPLLIHLLHAGGRSLVRFTESEHPGCTPVGTQLAVGSFLQGVNPVLAWSPRGG